MSKKTHIKSARPFKARLRHYHRSASPKLYSKRQKNWEDVSASQLGDATVPEAIETVDLTIKLTPKQQDA